MYQSDKTKEQLIKEFDELNLMYYSLKESYDKIISNSNQSEEDSQNWNIRFKKLSFFAPGLIFQFTRKPDGTYFVPIASEGIKEIFGCSPEDVVNTFAPIGNVIYPEDATKVINDIEYSAKHLTFFTCEFRVQIPGKEIQWIYSKSTPEKLADGSITWYGFNTDITERKKIENELILAKEKAEDSEYRFKLATASDKIGVWDWNVKDNKMIWEDRMFELYGISNNIFPNNIDAWTNGLHPEDKQRAIDECNAALNGEKDFNTTFRVLHPDGNVLYLKADALVLRDSTGKAIRMIGINKDITKNKYEEEQLLFAKEKAEESDRLKSAFLANMSHEIRTPMNGILGFAGLLKKPNLSGEQQQEYIRIIEKGGSRLLNIINDIIDISKIESGLMTLNSRESNINEQIEQIYTFFKSEVESKGMSISIKNSLPSKESIILTDHDKLYAILTNLVKNSIKYSVEGSIEFGYILKTDREPLELEFYVKDTGVGIAKDRQEAIFERFVQADFEDKMARQGAGLGLSISKAYVEMLGGKIWVESEEGKGSTFYFTLPYKTEPKEKIVTENATPATTENKIKNLKILIAEDDEDSALLIKLTVKMFSNRIYKTNTGVETIAACRNNPDIDLILMDIQMPNINGYEATRQIRQFNKDVIIIAQTAYGLSGDREKAIEAGCNDYISKPINQDLLTELIKKYF